MNPILKIYNDLTDEDILIALEEIFESELTGIYPEDSFVRNLARQTKDITNESTINLFGVQLCVTREASIRFVRNINSK